MNLSGGLILMIAMAVIIFVGMGAVNDITENSGLNETDQAYHSLEGANSVTGSLFGVFGYIILGIGAFVAIKAFKLA